MHLGSKGIVSLVGTMVMFASLFITAIHGVTPAGINSSSSITLFETTDGQIILVASIILLGMHISKNGIKFSWILGLAILIFAGYSLFETKEFISAQPDFVQNFLKIGVGYYSLICGAIIVTSSILFEAQEEKIAQANTSTSNFDKTNIDQDKVSSEEKTFLELKEALKHCYPNFTKVVSDKEHSWMVKSNDGTQGYIHLLDNGTYREIDFSGVDNKPLVEYLEEEINDKGENSNNSPDTSSVSQEIEKLFALKEKGALTEDEFLAQKQKLLNS